MPCCAAVEKTCVAVDLARVAVVVVKTTAVGDPNDHVKLESACSARVDGPIDALVEVAG